MLRVIQSISIAKVAAMRIQSVRKLNQVDFINIKIKINILCGTKNFVTKRKLHSIHISAMVTEQWKRHMNLKHNLNLFSR